MIILFFDDLPTGNEQTQEAYFKIFYEYTKNLKNKLALTSPIIFSLNKDCKREEEE